MRIMVDVETTINPVYDNDDGEESREHEITSEVEQELHRVFRECVRDAVAEDAILDAIDHSDMLIVEGWESLGDYGKITVTMSVNDEDPETILDTTE